LTTVVEWGYNEHANPLSIRVLTVNDHEEFLALMTQLNGYSYNLSRDEFGQRLDEISKTGGVIVVGTIPAGNEFKIIGTGRLVFEPKFGQSVAHIEDIVVSDKHRHRGFASQIVKHLVKVAKKTDSYKIILDSKSDLAPLYRACGFIQGGVQMVIRND
jgi:ribosomal protein S18 acetylase RimI-like enzyme